MKKSRWGTLDPFYEFGDILGRKVANTSFLQALLRLNPFDEYHFFLESEEQLNWHKNLLKESFPELSAGNALVFHRKYALHRILPDLDFTLFHLSDPFAHFVNLCRVRNYYARTLFPVTALSHSLSYAQYVPECLRHIWDGVSSRDRIIVSSQSGKNVWEKLFHGLAARIPGQNKPWPQLSVIPLGLPDSCFMDADETSFQAERLRRRLAQRQALGVEAETVFLCLGRICPSSKMDLAPLFSACKRAERLGLNPDSYRLLIAGWTESTDPLPEALERLGRSMGIPTSCIPRPDQEQCQSLLAAADVFISVADNIQETFGLTLLEAGAAGLVSLVSDYNGYRDIITDGETGFLIPSLGFSETFETNLLAGLWHDNQIHLRLAQASCLDLPFFAERLFALAQNPGLRERLGNNARRKILTEFSWPVLLKRYLALWTEAAAIPLGAGEEARLRQSIHPLAPDYGQTFAHYCTQTLCGIAAEETLYRLTELGEKVYREQLPPFFYAGLELMLEQAMLRPVFLAARKSCSAEALLRAALPFSASSHPKIAKERAAFFLLWAIKHDYLEPVRP